jgi:hypothetical protein
MEEGQVEITPTCNAHKESVTIHELLECYNVTEEDQEEDDPRNVQVPETEGECDIVCLALESNRYVNPLRVCKVNIDTKEKLKFANIGDYWNDETVENIADLLRKYQDLFSTTFSEMKGIAGELGEMKIPLKPYSKPVRQRPCRLNPKCKEKVKAELDRMIESGIIEPVAESEWIIPMVVQDKKTGGIIIFVDLRKLNDACLHDPFSNPLYR